MMFLVRLQVASDVFLLGRSLLRPVVSPTLRAVEARPLVCIWLTDGGKGEDYGWKVFVGQAQRWSSAVCPHCTGRNSSTWPHLSAKEAGELSLCDQRKGDGTVNGHEHKQS